MSDRTDDGGPSGPSWVDPPELPDPVVWGAPRSLSQRSPTDSMARTRQDELRGGEQLPPGHRPSPPGRGRGRARRRDDGSPWTRARPWLVVALVVLVASQLPGLVVDRVAGQQGHAAPPDDAVQVRYAASEGVVGDATFERGDALADRATHEELWASWTELVPPYYVRRVEAFEIASDGTGPGTFAAYVSPLDDGGDRWLLAIDPADAAENPEHYNQTLVHELAHILTLGSGSRTPGTGPFASLADAREACGGPATRNVCVEPDSLLGRFVERFWSVTDVAAADEVRARSVDGDITDAVLATYQQRRSSFVSPYALTDPAEDIAETITALAFGRTPARGSVAAQKVAFVRDDPEVLALVDRVRSAMLDRATAPAGG